MQQASRRLEASPSARDTAIFTRVEIDDDDPDTDPSGDHTEVAPVSPILRQDGGSGIPCVTAPLSQGLLVAGEGIIT